jgi:hypothetical protein
MPDAAITFDALQSLQVHADFAPQIAFDDVFPILDRVHDLRKLLFGQVLGSNAGIDVGAGQDILGVAWTNAINVTQGDVDAFVRRNLYSDDASHMCLSLLFSNRAGFSPAVACAAHWCKSPGSHLCGE